MDERQLELHQGTEVSNVLPNPPTSFIVCIVLTTLQHTTDPSYKLSKASSTSVGVVNSV